MEKYKPFKMGDKSYCLSSKDVEEISEISVVITQKALKNDKFKNNEVIKQYKICNSKSFVNVVCNKEDEQEIRDVLESFGCLCD